MEKGTLDKTSVVTGTFNWDCYGGNRWTIDFYKSSAQFNVGSVTLDSGLEIPRHTIEAVIYRPHKIGFLGEWWGHITEGDEESDAELVIRNNTLDPSSWDIGHDRIAQAYFLRGHLIAGRVSNSRNHDICEDSINSHYPSEFRNALDGHFHQYDTRFDFSAQLSCLLSDSNLPSRAKQRFRSFL